MKERGVGQDDGESVVRHRNAFVLLLAALEARKKNCLKGNLCAEFDRSRVASADIVIRRAELFRERCDVWSPTGG